MKLYSFYLHLNFTCAYTYTVLEFFLAILNVKIIWLRKMAGLTNARLCKHNHTQVLYALGATRAKPHLI
jgi:hypothetical protein